MNRKIISLILMLTLAVGLVVPAVAADPAAIAAADRLNSLGLFQGVGVNDDGTLNYALDRAPTRQEAVTLLVRLLGKEAEALAGSWEMPFEDVDNWAIPYVGYAYANALTSGTSATKFSGSDTVSASQYLTFVLRALGYSSDSDFSWDSAWTLTDELGITGGEYGAATAFTRGDAVTVSANALDKPVKSGGKTLLETINEAGSVGDTQVQPVTGTPESTAPATTQQYDPSQPLSDDEVVLSNGVRLGMTYEEVAALVGDNINNFSDGDEESYCFGYNGAFYIFSANESGELILWHISIQNSDNFGQAVDPVFRDIRLGDTMESVFDKFPVIDRTLKQWAIQTLYGDPNYKGTQYSTLQFVADSYYSMTISAGKCHVNITFSRVEQTVKWIELSTN